MRHIFFSIIFFSATILASSPMTFSTKGVNSFSGRSVIFASGDIEQGTALKFINFVRENNIGHATVYFNSYGGNLMEGIYLGEAIRKLRLDTSVAKDGSGFSGICASACAYACAGGVARYIYSDQQRIGLHQFYNDRSNNVADISVTQNITSSIAKHLHDMGVNDKAFILASSTKSNEMYWLTQAEALELNFANDGKTKTGSF